jgi:hypothetical protein
MFLVFNKDDGLVLHASETEPLLAPGEDSVFAHDSDLNLSNYETIKVIAKEGCHLELTPTAEWNDKVSGGTNFSLDGKIAKLEHYDLILMEAVARLSEATPGTVSSELMAELVLAGRRTIDQVPADIQKDVSGTIETAGKV